MDAFAVDPGPLATAYDLACRELERRHFVEALWARRLDVWSDAPDVQRAVGNRLGWLGALDFIRPHVEGLEAFGASVRAGAFTDVVLMGMGGSSLAPEVLRQVLGIAPGYPRFHMLDSVDPEAVSAAFRHAGSSLFVLASKSGSTIEPNAMAAEAMRRLLAAGQTNLGARFVTITDEGTPMHQRAVHERFRDVFVNPADVGGRYSALTYFGMVPAAAMGAPLERIVAHGRVMEGACRDASVTANPGLALGAFMAAGARGGRDKLTLVAPPRYRAFGLWAEQLVAESTGKRGRGIVPVTDEPADAPLGEDRLAVVLEAGPDRITEPERQRIRDAGVPTATLRFPEPAAVGGEFLRWEVATAAAGLLLGINPFDEPNVQQAKDATRRLLDTYASRGTLPFPEPTASIDGARIAASRAAAESLQGEPVALVRLLRPRDYFALLAYVPPDDPRFAPTLQDLRRQVSALRGCATTLGYGPRYLHSTGQLHKGGPDNAVFLVLTAEPSADLPVPDAPFTFGVLEMAQALGDFQSLDAAGRRALHVHLPRRDPDVLRRVATVLTTG